MAASATHGSSLQVLLDTLHTHLLECKVCMETFSFSADEQPARRPMSLCCGHVLCAECVRLLSTSSCSSGGALQCPFCRLPSDPTRVSPCQPLRHLQELLQEEHWSPASSLAPPSGQEEEALDRGALQLVRAFGGWGVLVNPTGLAAFRSGALAVVHDGKERVVVLGPQGRQLHGFSQRGAGLIHPLGVAVLPDGQVVVSDAGDTALKVFTSRGGAVAEARDWLRLPWGVAASSGGRVLVADDQQGAVLEVEVDPVRGELRGKRVLLRGLQNPRAIACCPHTGHLAVVEHLCGPRHTHTPLHTHNTQHTHSTEHTHASEHGNPPEHMHHNKDTHTPQHTLIPEHTHTSKHVDMHTEHTRSSALTHTLTHTPSTRLRLYSRELTLLSQIDSLSLSLRTGSPAPPLYLTAVTFDPAGHLIAADARSGVVWSLGRPRGDRPPTLTPLVSHGLVRPVGLAVTGHTLVILDSGDHSVKMYSAH